MSPSNTVSRKAAKMKDITDPNSNLAGDKLVPILPSNVNMAEYYAMGSKQKAAIEDFATSMNTYFRSGIKKYDNTNIYTTNS